MKINSFYGGLPQIGGDSPDTTKPSRANQAIPGSIPQRDSFGTYQSIWPRPDSITNTKAFNTAQYYGAARSLSAMNPQAESNDDAWRDYLGAGTLVRDLRHSRFVTDLFQGFNLRKAPPLDEVFTRIPTPGGNLPLPIPKSAAGAVADVITPAGRIPIAIPKPAAAADDLAKAASKASSLTKAAGKLGRGLGRAVPILNAGLAALDVHDAVKIAQDPKASAGKKALGVVTAALSVASVVPGVGLVAGLGASLFGFIRDAVK